ncbi:MAG: DUF5615 family PIN-like protein [Bacteroidales bacterium]
MKLLFDQNISYRITRKVSDFFPDCKHISTIGLNDAEDPDIWKFAKENRYVIVTIDSDFYDLALIKGIPPKIIWIRTGNISTDDLAGILKDNQQQIVDFVHEERDVCLMIEVFNP